MDTTQIRRKAKKIWYIFLLIVALVLVGFIYTRYFYVVGTGVKSGQLNYVVYKGYVFKTYEGRLIQAGLKSTPGVAVQSNEFIFSVGSKEVAEKLMMLGGKNVDLQYKEYMGALPWRGYSNFVVDSIMSVADQ